MHALVKTYIQHDRTWGERERERPFHRNHRITTARNPKTFTLKFQSATIPDSRQTQLLPKTMQK